MEQTRNSSERTARENSFRIYFIAVIGIINFLAFLVLAINLGGDAVNGKVESGHYYLMSHGVYTEVNKKLFRHSRIHDSMVSAVASYNENQASYSAVPLFLTDDYNSNSFTYTPLKGVGLTDYFNDIGLKGRSNILGGRVYPGWGSEAPGL